MVKKCEWCGCEYEAKNAKQRYCDDDCRAEMKKFFRKRDGEDEMLMKKYTFREIKREEQS